MLERDGFEKIYDLSERVIPKALRDAQAVARPRRIDWAHATKRSTGWARARRG